MARPRISGRVVCTLGVTIDTLAPTSALSSVDFPAFGAPIKATKPQRRSCSPGSAIAPVRFDAFAGEHGGSGGLLGAALGASRPFGRRETGKRHRHAQDRIVVRSGARH